MIGRQQIAIEELDVLLVEAAALAACGPTFRICVRREARREGDRIWVSSARLVRGTRDYQLPLTPPTLNVLHHLAIAPSAQTATQIARELRASGHYWKVGRTGRMHSWKIAPTSVKVYIARIRTGIAAAFASAHLSGDPARILLSIPTANQVLYQLRANVHFADQTEIA